MKKITLLAFIVAFNANSQDFSKKIEVPEGSEVSNYGFTRAGIFHVTASKKTYSGKKRNPLFRKFNPTNLDLDFEYRLKEPFRVEESSQYGDAFLYDNSPPIGLVTSKKPSDFLFTDGSVKNYDGKDWLPDDFVSITEFISKDYYISLGYTKGRANYKRKEKHTNIETKKQYKFFRRDLKTFESLYTDLNLRAEIEIDEETEFIFQYLDHDDQHFTLLTKNFFDKDENGKHPKKVEYILPIYNYDGDLVETRILTAEIEDKRLDFQGGVRLGKGSFALKTVYSTVKKDWTQAWVPQPIASGNVYNDIENQTYYTFGIITGGSKTKNKCVFMLDKFDYKGKKLWSKSYEQPTRAKKGNGFKDYVDHVRLVDAGNNLGIALADYKNEYFKVIEVNKESGEILNSVDYAGLSRYKLKYYDQFTSSFVLKDAFDKKFGLDYETIMAYSLNTKFKDFIDTQKQPDQPLNFVTSITDRGIVTIMANNKDNDFTLMKFNW